MKNIKITLLKNKRFTAVNKDDVSVQEDENNATVVEVEFPIEYEKFSKRVDFLNIRGEKWTIGLYQPEDQTISYADNFDKLNFRFTVPRPMAKRGELKMQFVAYLADDSNTIVPFHIVVITINESILFDGEDAEDEPNLMLKAYEYSNYALDTANEALTRSKSAEESALASEKSTKIAEESALSAETSASEAKASANSSMASAMSANLRANNAETSATNAEESAREARALASSAQSMANTAQTSANNAKSSANSAQTSATNAQTSATNAETSANSAKASASSAKTSATNAETSAKAAQESATSANTRATNAETSASNAEESARQSAESADNADKRATSAETISNTALTNSQNAVTTSNTANTKSTKALAIVDGLSVSSEEIDCEEQSSVEIQTNASTSMKTIHFKVPAPKKGTSYRNKGAWVETETYVNNEYYIDTVSRHGCTYYCKQTNINKGPVVSTEDEYWGLLSNKGSDAGVTIVDNLNSEQADYVLSAKQGKVLKELIATSVETAINNLINGAPDNLNTLNELALAIDKDASFSTTIKGLIQTNATNIDNNAKAIETNKTNISTNANGIATNKTNISTNATNIATNKSGIATNKTNISTNASGIATNKTNISKNTTDIATNKTSISNIANNTTVIENSYGGFAAGNGAKATASLAVQLGYGTNASESTLQFLNYLLVDKMGRIPKERVLDTVYPVGSIYLSATGTSPATLFGGSWTQLKDRFLLGAGDTYYAGNLGGEATHTLSISEMPAHTHDVKRQDKKSTSSGGAWYLGNGGTGVAGDYATSKGGGGAHNNMPPYLVIYMWQRIG